MTLECFSYRVVVGQATAMRSMIDSARVTTDIIFIKVQYTRFTSLRMPAVVSSIEWGSRHLPSETGEQSAPQTA